MQAKEKLVHMIERTKRRLRMQGIKNAYLAGGAAVWLGHNQSSNKVLGIVTDVLPVSLVENDSALRALGQQVLQVFTAEGRVAAQQRVGDDAHGPHVDGLAVALAVHNFRGGVAKRAGHGVERLFFAIEGLGDTKIGQNQIRRGLLSDIQKVFGLKVCNSR